MPTNNKVREQWIRFVEKLSESRDLDQLVPEVLADLCKTFDFGYAFCYEGDYTDVMTLTASHTVYPGDCLHSDLPLVRLMGPKLLQELGETRSVCFSGDRPADTMLAIKLGDIFKAKSLVLMTVVDDEQRVIAMAGLADRRAKVRHAKEDLQFALSIISTMSTYIKVQIYKKSADNTRRSLEATLDHMGVDVYVNDFYTHEILYVNRSMGDLYGVVENMMGKTCWKVLYENKTEECDFCPQKQLLDEDGNPTKVYSWDYQRPFDGAWFRVLSAAFRWVDGRMAHIVSSVDITENKRNEEITRRIAEYDYLTGLPNRYCLTMYMDKRLYDEQVGSEDLYLLFFDLDGFKAVNDTFGHRTGDELLKRIAQTLMDSPLTCKHCYRFGGDEFVVLWDTSTSGTLAELVRFLQNTFSRVWELEEGLVEVGASIGISHYPNDDVKTGSLIRNADQAMYVSKNRGRGKVHFYNEGNIIGFDEYMDGVFRQM